MINIDELRKVGISEHFNKEGFITDMTNHGMTCIVDIPSVGTGWYVPLSCIMQLSTDPGSVPKTELKTGDKATLIGGTRLRQVLLGGRLGHTVVLMSKLTPAERDNRIALKGENAWWCNVIAPTESGGTNYYVPISCLSPISDQQTETKAETKKEQEHMLYDITVLKVPSVLAQQGGAVEEIVVPRTEVVGMDLNSCVLQIGAANAETINALKEQKSTLKVVARHAA